MFNSLILLRLSSQLILTVWQPHKQWPKQLHLKTSGYVTHFLSGTFQFNSISIKHKPTKLALTICEPWIFKVVNFATSSPPNKTETMWAVPGGGFGLACVLPPRFWFCLTRSSKDWNSSSELHVSSGPACVVTGTAGGSTQGFVVSSLPALVAWCSSEGGRLCLVLQVLLITASRSSSLSLRKTGESQRDGGRFSVFRTDLGVLAVLAFPVQKQYHFPSKKKIN